MKEFDYKKELKSEEEEEEEKEKKKSLEDELLEHYKKLVQYKNNLIKLEALIQLEKDPDSRNEFQ